MSTQAKLMIQNAALYVPADCEGIRVDRCDDDYFVGTGEESGDEYRVYYDEVDLEKDLIYKLVLMNVDEVE